MIFRHGMRERSGLEASYAGPLAPRATGEDRPISRKSGQGYGGVCTHGDGAISDPGLFPSVEICSRDRTKADLLQKPLEPAFRLAPQNGVSFGWRKPEA